jgi:uncharacterized integral membrane protein
MKTFLKLIVLVPIGLIAFAFVIANRHMTTVSFDPFSGGDIAGPQITAPLFIILILAAMMGVVLGGVAVWFRQGRYRRAARQSQAEAARLRLDLDRLRAVPALPAPNGETPPRPQARVAA